MVEGDPRRFYFPFMALLIIVIAILIRQSLAGEADSDIGQHVQLRRSHLAVRVDVPELQAARGGPAEAVDQRAVGDSGPLSSGSSSSISCQSSSSRPRS